MPKLKPQADSRGDPVHEEAATWRAVGTGWRQLFGDFRRLGVSFEWHEFQTVREFDWAPSFHPGSLELCLNLTGRGVVSAGAATAEFRASSVGFYRQGQPPLQALRAAGEGHRFITVELAPDFVSRQLESAADLHPLVALVAQGDPAASGVSETSQLNARQLELVESLRHPPVLSSAQTLWYRAKAIELMGEFFFRSPEGDELFCHRQQRVARDRIEAVRARLRQDLARVPTLEELAREVGCSPFYLSRTFSRHTGQSIPQYVRQLRMERAAELLKTGRFNVTEVALEVGYNSPSHFSHAFHQTFGCCPGLYPIVPSDPRRKPRST